MYNRYIHNGTSYTRVVENDDSTLPPSTPNLPPETDSPCAPHTAEETTPKKAGLAGLLKSLKLDGLDKGDILLLLILLFLFLDGDDTELVITLGLLLLLGL